MKFNQIIWLKKTRFHLQKIISSLSRFVGTVCIIVSAAFGSVAALAVAGILVWWTCRKKRRNTKGTEGKCCIHVFLIANSGKKIALDLVYFMTRLDGHQTDVILLMRDKFCFMSIVHPLIVLFSFAFYVSLSRSSTTEVAMSRR